MRIFPELTQDQEFESLGASGFSGNLNDRQYAYLKGAGYTEASLPDAIAAFKNFNPSTLFNTAGARGLFYDFSDYNTLFTDTAGTSRITGTGQSLALVLDKSRGLVLGPELVTNGDFSSGTGWTLGSGWSIASGQLVGSAVPTFIVASQATAALVAGRTYEIRYDITSFTSGSARLSFTGGTAVTGTNRASTGSFRELLVANSGHTAIAFGSAGAGFTGTIDKISVRELPGNHVTQGTAGSQPLTVTFGAGYRGIQTDGVDDFLQTAAIDFSNSDKVTVIAGVRKLSDAALAALIEIGVGGTAGTAGLGAPGSAGATYRFLSQGTVGATALSAASFAAPDTAVLTGISDISGDSVILRRNGVQVAQNTADQGTGNYSNAPVYLFRRGGTSLPANVICTFILVINRTLTATELAQLENYANLRTGAY